MTDHATLDRRWVRAWTAQRPARLRWILCSPERPVSTSGQTTCATVCWRELDRAAPTVPYCASSNIALGCHPT